MGEIGGNKEVIKEKKLITQGATAFVVKIFGAGLGFLFLFLLAKKFGNTVSGTYNLCISIITVAIILGKFGLDNALIRFVAIYNNKNKGGTIKKIDADTTKFSLCISLFLVVLLFVLAPVILKLMNKPYLTRTLRLMILAIIPNCLLNIKISIMKGIKKTQLALFFESCLTSLLNIILLLLGIVIFHIEDTDQIMSTYTIACYLSFIISYIYWIVIKRNYNSEEDESYKLKKIIDVALPLLMVASMNYVVSSTDTIMLGFFGSSEADIGLYNYGIKITQLSSMLLVAINSVLGPRFSVLWAEKKKDDIEILMKKTTRVMTALGILFLLGMIIAGKFVVGIFTGWEAVTTSISYKVLLITSVGQFFVLATGPVASLLMMTGYQKVHRNTTVFCAISNIVLNSIFIPMWGLYGAAIASAISLIIKNLYAAYAVYKYLKISII